MEDTQKKKINSRDVKSLAHELINTVLDKANYFTEFSIFKHKHFDCPSLYPLLALPLKFLHTTFWKAYLSWHYYIKKILNNIAVLIRYQ